MLDGQIMKWQFQKICRELKNATSRSISQNKRCLSPVQAERIKSPSFYFPKFQTLQGREFSEALQKFSIHSMNEICLLENNLITRLENCKVNKQVEVKLPTEIDDKIIKSLENSLKIEKEKQKLLNATIEEIEQDLGETFLQKEKFKNMALDVSKILMCFKNLNKDTIEFSKMKLFGEIFNDICFCKDCIMGEDINISTHNTFKLQDCLDCIAKLINAGCILEKDICEIKQHEFELKAFHKELQNKNSELKMTISQCNENFAAHNTELVNLKNKQTEKLTYFSSAIEENDIINMQSQTKNCDLSHSLNECRSRIHELETKASSLSNAVEEKKKML
ncbi:uncharacterized protein CEXT_304451 [Caerostris extrusa]|uniref:Uncharacterized protein n=1 Tax=Caerostris extrusa TaxID=172846 RepID=A0AAV4P646_CAEEX|nr:uncharacterized protein CEXT_304451 [Caerostris extrusa]